ncbi:MAG: hypothetical protein GY899_18650 [Verrucomicrobiaceae bacterium]|nr:hypothetical protein [Verrucomicrobiaceae bacterium]
MIRHQLTLCAKEQVDGDDSSDGAILMVMAGKNLHLFSLSSPGLFACTGNRNYLNREPPTPLVLKISHHVVPVIIIAIIPP